MFCVLTIVVPPFTCIYLNIFVCAYVEEQGDTGGGGAGFSNRE